MSKSLVSMDEGDVAVLQAMVAEFRAKKGLSIGRRGQSSLDTDDMPGAPEVYLARTPAGGIPALNTVGTGTTGDDIPGNAICEVYRLTSQNQVVPVGGLSKTVYNFGSSAIAEHSWAYIARDKFGRWLVLVPSSAITGDGPWAAKLTEATGAASGHDRTSDASGTWSNIGSPLDFTDDAWPVEMDGVAFTPKDTANVLRWPDKTTSGVSVFLPVQSADATAYTTGGTYYSGFMSTGSQGFKGVKFFLETLTLRHSNSASLPIISAVEEYRTIDTTYTVVAGALVIANGPDASQTTESTGQSYGGGLHIYPAFGDGTHSAGGGAWLNFWGNPSLSPTNGPSIRGTTQTFGGSDSTLQFIGDKIVVPDPSAGRVYVGTDNTVEVNSPGLFWLKPSLSTFVSLPAPAATLYMDVIKNGLNTTDGAYLGGMGGAWPDGDFGARESIRNYVFPTASSLTDEDSLPVWGQATGWESLANGISPGWNVLMGFRSGIHFDISWQAGVSVAAGGTGGASATAYSVLTGGTTSTGAFQSVSGVGTAGQVLTSNGAAALPTWQAAGVSIGGAVSGGTAGRIPYEAAGPVLADSSSLRYDPVTSGLVVNGPAGATGQLGTNASGGSFSCTGSITADICVNSSYAGGFHDGTHSVFLCDGTNAILYTATTPSDWAASTPPTDVLVALDRIAAALTALGHAP